MRKYIKFALPGIIFLAIVLRFISLNQSLWLDEATTALVARMPIADIFTKFLPGDFHPPFYYLLMKGWVLLFGASEISLRMPSVILGVLTIYFVYLIAKKLSSKRTALIASILLATSGLAIYYSQEARMYSLAAALVTLSVYLFVEKKWTLFGITLALIGLTDYVALSIIPVFIILSLKDIKKMFLSLVPLLVAFAFWAPTFVRQLGGGVAQRGTAWWSLLGTTTFKNILLIPTKFIFGRIGFDNRVFYGAITLLAFSLFVFLLFKAKKASKTIWFWLISPIIIGILVGLIIPTLSYFRFLFCLPAFYILIAEGIENVGKAKYILLSLVIAINVLSSGYYLTNPKFQREDWRGIAQVVGEDTIVYPANSQKEALVYYQLGNQIVNFTDFVGGPQTIWLSRYVWDIFDPTDAARIKVESLGYNKVSELNLNGVEFWQYSRVVQYARGN